MRFSGIQGEENLTFAVAVHAATVCSTIVVLRKEIWDLLQGLFRFTWNEETIYIAKIVLSMIPVAIVGVFLKDQVEALFGSGLLVVGFALLLTACLLAFAYYARPRAKTTISFRDAFVIGIAQALVLCCRDYPAQDLRLQRVFFWETIRKRWLSFLS